ncbi:MAG: L-ribulose-5-phosphate 4-epimerase [Candidatus Raymondbacteria bacterium RifOxyA12_full_50_37]|uniref:L-ribulose-5-phosphate 4-epimerase n=1 Tax=Candidatus Raymondbacteria bacterium RIFOXYD12_FULL_49_13 TaxID=1817890 RepID=A0A1F7EZF6_UNCRA|nr:MAG: L-ribulose-5-phosphate 4-epimerase [Candidatus Raymondbacteria bacterium RifOxyA12_full_50_37]OGJ94234.1 MAG: L-ribulose-5-phosphate 4-epimerase [Candidatus Raymondbacteria bacterium RifOxyC12_full_50_8]OGJ94466.1 MAG: L-ribulose-5-phosphate 4-epimerase [Candidatus Raymondbacteria bacterium RIFOXYA2_FULL_49_16]OGJ99222.1 MAG: L-ribulose-5-phosphate 4-epimerase [Candidatus Raymondbacteria bacterium RIFOXYC2_FULL_50_21]OGJ99770.1 MAG: L-ribulose-5-phosphate 4-epimerase [Candidatus Raymond
MYEKLKQECYQANMLLQQHRLITLTFGNVSVIDRKAGVVAIKPSGVPYKSMRAADMVVLDLTGKQVAGKLNPSSDTPTHLRLYRAFKTIGGIVHTHSEFATAFAQAGKPIPCFGTTHADYFYGDVPLTRKMTQKEVKGAYEVETGNVIIERFAEINPDNFPGVLVRNHGPFTWGTNGIKAVENSLVLELLAKTAFVTMSVNKNTKAIDKYLLDKHFLRKHGKNAYYGQK